MDYEVLVVGGGIGGLTTGALLAGRGVNVCLFEREARVGGCVANFEHFGYKFEPTAGLYGGWEKDGVHEGIFSELRISPPEIRRLSPAYVVRLPDQAEVSVGEDAEQLERNLRDAFPECADAAVRFYRELAPLDDAWRAAIKRTADSPATSKLKRLFALAPGARLAPKILTSLREPTAKYLAGTSSRFQRFIDAQLRTFANGPIEQCSYPRAAAALMAPRHGLFAIRGGAEMLAKTMADSLKKNGGTVRLNTTVLRLAFDSEGCPVGVDLLSGEKVTASKAIVSNLTIWDTYGKLVGLGRTPHRVSAELKHLRGWGAYLLFLAMDQPAGERLPTDHVLALTDWQDEEANHAETAQFMFAAAPLWGTPTANVKRLVTVSMFTEAEQWFTFHHDETEHEQQDQQTLERCWRNLHTAIPELGSSIEIIETATPRTFYDQTRRKLGMAGGLCYPTDSEPTYRTVFPKLLMVGDTVSPGIGIAGVSQSALAVANTLTRAPN